MKFVLLISLFLVLNFFDFGADAKSVRQYERQVSSSGTGGTPEATTLSPEELLMRLKVYEYSEKLKAKEAKKKAKAEKKKAKDAAFRAYLTSALSASTATAASAPAAPLSPALAAPPVPAIPDLGAWKSQFLLAAAAAAASQTTETPDLTTQTIVQTENDPETDEAERAVINQIVKRYAPMVRDKFYGKNHHQYNNKQSGERKYYFGHEEEDSSNQEESEEAGAKNYKSGTSNKFGKGPNGQGYEDAKVNQAGCSGSHINICSGTTVYLTNPDEEAASLISSIDQEDQEADEAQDQNSDDQVEEDEEPEPQVQKKQRAKHGHKKY